VEEDTSYFSWEYKIKSVDVDELIVKIITGKELKYFRIESNHPL